MIRHLTMIGALVLNAPAVNAQQGIGAPAASQPGVSTTNPAQPGQTASGQTGLAQSNLQTQTFGRVGSTPWFSNLGVRQELKLNDEQFNRLNRDYRQNWDRYQNDLRGIGTGLSEQQRRDRALELERTFNQNFNQTSQDIFSDAAQRDRFNQLYLQYQGYGAFNDADLRRRMNLSQDQINRISELERNWQRDMNTMRREFASDRLTATRRYRDWSRELNEQLNKILNEDQRRLWRDTAGNPYEFSPDIYFPNPTPQRSLNSTGTGPTVPETSANSNLP